MAEEKPFEPTQSRLDRAKREGDVARSQELGNVAAFGAGLLATTVVVAPLGSAARATLHAAASGRIDSAAIGNALALMLVPAGVGACAAALVNVLQSGGVRFAPVTCKPERLSPVENLKRMFSKESVVTAARATVAFICAGIAIVPAFTGIYSAALHALDIQSVAAAAWNGALHTALASCVVGGIFAAADFGVQFARWRSRLRMSFEEARRDQKEHDGDPLARGRRRAMHRQISRGSLRKVKDASFVITNPTHIAIALEYRPPQVPVPRILVRAADDAAARVRELATAYAIPIVENVALARTLYATSDAGDFIPHEAYIAVAEVVASLAKAGVLAL